MSDQGSPGNQLGSSPLSSTLPTMEEHDPEEDLEEDTKSPRSTATGSGRTRLSRASKTDSLLRMNRRVSMKPQRKGLQVKMPNSSTDEDIKKFYLNNKLGSAAARQNALETIFEEPAVVRNELRLIGLKKLKRSMTCKDGVTISKTTVQSRRKKIKTLFGTSSSTKKFNKLSMDAFLMHLKSLSEDEGDNERDGGPSQGPSGTSSSSC